MCESVVFISALRTGADITVMAIALVMLWWFLQARLRGDGAMQQPQPAELRRDGNMYRLAKKEKKVGARPRLRYLTATLTLWAVMGGLYMLLMNTSFLR